MRFHQYIVRRDKAYSLGKYIYKRSWPVGNTYVNTYIKLGMRFVVIYYAGWYGKEYIPKTFENHVYAVVKIGIRVVQYFSRLSMTYKQRRAVRLYTT